MEGSKRVHEEPEDVVACSKALRQSVLNLEEARLANERTVQLKIAQLEQLLETRDQRYALLLKENNRLKDKIDHLTNKLEEIRQLAWVHDSPDSPDRS